MKDSSYVLCFRGITKSGKKEIFPLYKDKLRFIDEFTTYGYNIYKCSDENRLFHALPKEVKKFIEDYFDISGMNFKDCFFVRKDVKNIRRGRTDLSVLFYNDADIVYAKRNDVLESLLFFNITVDEYNKTDALIKIKRAFFSELYDLLSLNIDSNLTDEIDNVIRRENDFSLSRLKGIMCIPETLGKIVNYVCDDYLLKRKVLLLIKKYKREARSITSCKTELLNSLEINSGIQNRKFNYDFAKSKFNGFDDMLVLSKAFFEEKYGSVKRKEPVLIKVVKDDETFIEELEMKLENSKDETYIKIITMLVEQIKLKIKLQDKINDDFDSYEVDYNKCEEKILELDNLRIAFENLRNETIKSKMISEVLIHSQLDKLDLEKSLEESLKKGNDDLIDYYRKKIADIEEQIIGLENGDLYYSDAGILVRKDDMDDDMKM